MQRAHIAGDIDKDDGHERDHYDNGQAFLSASRPGVGMAHS
jgi:hypothetical protein